eukprot:7339507-Prymnesium_polylepis.1
MTQLRYLVYLADGRDRLASGGAGRAEEAYDPVLICIHHSLQASRLAASCLAVQELQMMVF